MPGVNAGLSQTVAFKPFLGLVLQPKLLPIKFAPVILELELVNSYLDPIITPDKPATLGESTRFF